MDWLNFITGMTKALVWPGVTIFTLLTFRAQVAHLFEHFGKRKVTAKGGGLEVTISEELDRVEAKIETLILPNLLSDRSSILEVQGVPHGPIQSRVTAGFTVNPSLPPAYIISQSWLGVIEALKEAQAARSPKEPLQKGPFPITGTAALRFAIDEEMLTSEQVEELHELRRIRNISVHEASSDVSLTDALRYSDLANKIVATIRMKSQIK